MKKAKTPAAKTAGAELEDVWNAREAALSRVLGKPASAVLHSMIPFVFGGAADVMSFPKYIPGATYVTAELTGQPVGQKKNRLGNYELMICNRKPDPACSNLIANLAHITCEAKLQPGDTMDIEEALGKRCPLKHLIFWHPDNTPTQFELFGRKCGLLLCVGITSDELEFAREQGPDALVSALIEERVFPYTVPRRKSVFQ